MIRTLAKRVLSQAGWSLTRREPLLDFVPATYEQSPFLPRVYRQSLERILRFRQYVEAVQNTPGAVVECGVSLGHGLLYWILLSEGTGPEREFYGFDSFSGFPSPTPEDGAASRRIVDGFYASPEEVVWRVLREGGVPEKVLHDRVSLVKGYFADTLPAFTRPIALLHLDCDLYGSYKTCLEQLYDRVVTGGLISFDDYGDPAWPGAKLAVDEFFATRTKGEELIWLTAGRCVIKG